MIAAYIAALEVRPLKIRGPNNWYRLGRVRTVVSYCYYLAAQTGLG